MDTTDFEYVILPLIDFKYVLASDFKDGDDFFTLVSPLEDVEDDDGIKKFVYIKITYENGKIWFAYYSNYYSIVYLDIEEMEAINECMRRFKNYIKRRTKNEESVSVC